MDCVRPIIIKVKGNDMEVPCRKCIMCKRLYISEWATRLENQLREYNHIGDFITLTYDDDHIPNGENLQERDVTLWLKRLRAQNVRVTYKYWYTGEYGETYGRPHYHVILMADKMEGLDVDYEAIWGNGQVHVGEANEKTIHYTLSYVLKDENYMQGNRTPVFHRMSKGMGLETAKNDWRQIIQDGGIRQKNGYIKRIPRFYIDKILNEDKVLLNEMDVLNYFPEKPNQSYDLWLKQIEEAKKQKVRNLEAKRALLNKKDPN